TRHRTTSRRATLSRRQIVAKAQARIAALHGFALHKTPDRGHCRRAFAIRRRAGNGRAMKVAIVKERRAHERRVAATPDTVKQMIALGLGVSVETGAGAEAGFLDAAYEAAGAGIAADEAAALGDADLVLKVQRPVDGEIGKLKRGAVLIGLLAPTQNKADVDAYAQAGVNAFALELVPRITRAQTMDVLSSQANLAGYKSVID